MSGITLDTIDASLHSIAISDGTNTLAVAADGSIAITDNGGSLTIDGTVAATQSGTWDIGTVTTLTGITNDVNIADGGNSITVDGSVTVSATALDIRALASSTDSVEIKTAGGQALAIDGSGYVTANINGTVNTTAGSIATWKSTAQTINGTVSQLAATPLTGRDSMIIQNLGSVDIYIGPSNAITDTDGTKIPKGASMEMPFGASSTVWAITASGSANVRISEYAY